AVEAEPVVAPARGRLVGEARPVQRREQPVAGAVAGEDAPGPVAAVGGGREAEEVHRRGGIAEAGHRPPPVLLVAVGGALLARHPLPPLHQPRAAAAADDLGLELGQAGGGLAHAFSRRPLANSQCDQRYTGTASAAVTPRQSQMLTSLVPRKPKRM